MFSSWRWMHFGRSSTGWSGMARSPPPRISCPACWVQVEKSLYSYLSLFFIVFFIALEIVIVFISWPGIPVELSEPDQTSRLSFTSLSQLSPVFNLTKIFHYNCKESSFSASKCIFFFKKFIFQTKLWNFFTDPNPSTRNLYLNIGFVSDSSSSTQQKKAPSLELWWNNLPLHLQGVFSHILWILPTFLGIIPDTSRQQDRLYHKFTEVGEMKVKVIGSCLERVESDQAKSPRKESWFKSS